jgi:hypothetical protein
MANLYEILADAQNGQALSDLGRQYGLTPEQTQGAVAALLPAISMGLKQATATSQGLGNMLALMAGQPGLQAMYDDPRAAFSPQGRDAGNAALAAMFGSPDASRAITGQAQQLSGVTSSILKKLLPVIVGMILSGLLKSGSGKATPAPAPRAPEPTPDAGGGAHIDILKQIFGQGQGPSGGGTVQAPGSGSSPWGIPPIGDILGEDKGGAEAQNRPAPKMPAPIQPAPTPVDQTDQGGGPVPSGDVLGQILRELEKQVREGKVKPVIVGPFEIDVGGGGVKTTQAPQSPDQPQASGGDILGQILKEVLGGKGQAQSGYGAALFGDKLEPGTDLDQDRINSLQDVFDRFVGGRRR